MVQLDLKTYYKFWGKAGRDDSKYHPLVYHSLDVAAVGRIMLRGSPMLTYFASGLQIEAQTLLNWVTFLCALHDIGKFADGFQSQRQDLSDGLQKRTVRANYQEKHWSIGYRFLQSKTSQIFPDANRDILRLWFSACAGHHGRPPLQNMFAQPLSLQFPSLVDSAMTEFITDLKRISNITNAIGVQKDEQIIKRMSWWIAGLVTTADWIGSNREWFEFYEDLLPLDQYFNEIAIKNAHFALNQSGISPVSIAPEKDIHQLFPIIVMPTALQDMVQKTDLPNEPQLHILEDVTGNGKTEAALLLAHRLMVKGLGDGIYFALPTMATANEMHKRVKSVYPQFYSDATAPSFVLAHSASKIQSALEYPCADNTDPEDSVLDCVQWVNENRKKALLAHIGVGTVDQALLAVLQARHQSLRLFGLSRKVLIVDEVHASDDYIHTLLRNLLRFHAAQGGSAVLLSATLPIKMRHELIESYVDGLGMQLDGDLSERYPLLTHCSRGRLQEHHFEGAAVKKNVKFQPLYKIENVFDVVGGVLSAGGCVCWVRNTVYDALSAYDDACARFGDEKASLFHARFALGDRLNIENSITRSFGPKSGIVERHGKMIIATQVIEQSLDLDFDFIISDLAPIDLIIQRAGRLHRHKRNQVGTRITAGADERGDSIMGIFMPEMPKEPNENWYKSILPKAAKVYPHHGQLWLTARWIIQHGEFAMPADARDMIESVYGDDAQQDIPAAFELTENRAQGADGAAISMAKFNQLNLDVGYAADMITWAQDDNAPTRLGQAMTTVRLLRCESNRIVPLLYRNKSIDWELSQVPVYTAMISAEYQANRKDIEAAKTTMPDAGRFCKAVILDQNGSVWIGKAVDGRDRVVTVRYDSKRGLSVSQGENDEFDS